MKKLYATFWATGNQVKQSGCPMALEVARLIVLAWLARDDVLPGKQAYSRTGQLLEQVLSSIV